MGLLPLFLSFGLALNYEEEEEPNTAELCN